MLLLFSVQILPLALLGWLAIRPLSSPFARGAQGLGTAAVLLAATLAGIWPAWWLPWLMWFMFVAALLAPVRRPAGRGGASGWVAAAALALLGSYALWLSGQAIAGRTPPPGEAVDLVSPLRGDQFRVIHGGFSPLINPHMRTLGRATERQRAYYGQSYALDVIASGPLGFTARGIQPRDPSRWAIFGAAIHAPCSGIVAQATDGLPDMPVPEMDSEHMVGNHVLLRCGPADILLAHMMRGSLIVTPGDAVQEGDLLGRVGNSGNSSAPHLHFHAQRRGTPEAPFSGTPLPMRFDGRFPVRGSRL